MEKTHLFVLVLSLGLANACHKKADTDNGNAQLTSVAIASPDLTPFTGNLKSLLTGYRVAILSNDQTCSTLNQIKPLAIGDVSVDFKLRQGCDYSLTVEMGKLPVGAGFLNLEKIYFTNAHEGLVQEIKKEDFAGKKTYEVSVILKATADGIAAGFAKDTSLSTKSGSNDTNIRIQPVIEIPAKKTASADEIAAGVKAARERLTKVGGLEAKKGDNNCDSFAGKGWFTSPTGIYVDNNASNKRIFTCVPEENNALYMADCPVGQTSDPAAASCLAAVPDTNVEAPHEAAVIRVWTDSITKAIFPYCTAAAIDPDGDGWGWENGTSCKVP